MTSSEYKSFEFDESQCLSQEELISSLFDLDKDPKSTLYKRVNVRPPIPWMNIVLGLVVPVCVGFLWYIVIKCVVVPRQIATIGWLVLSASFIVACTKPAIIALVKIYQYFAPDRIRNKCRFEPSCSQYMILAIQKYGVVRGICRGGFRLYRCSIKKDGGYDFLI